MTDYHINVFYSEEDGGYIADIPDLDACSAFGSTPEEAWRRSRRRRKRGLPPRERLGAPSPSLATDRPFTADQLAHPRAPGSTSEHLRRRAASVQ